MPVDRPATAARQRICSGTSMTPRRAVCAGLVDGPHLRSRLPQWKRWGTLPPHVHHQSNAVNQRPLPPPFHGTHFLWMSWRAVSKARVHWKLCDFGSETGSATRLRQQWLRQSRPHERHGRRARPGARSTGVGGVPERTPAHALPRRPFGPGGWRPGAPRLGMQRAAEAACLRDGPCTHAGGVRTASHADTHSDGPIQCR